MMDLAIQNICTCFYMVHSIDCLVTKSIIDKIWCMKMSNKLIQVLKKLSECKSKLKYKWMQNICRLVGLVLKLVVHTKHF